MTVSFDGGENYTLLRWMSDLQGAAAGLLRAPRRSHAVQCNAIPCHAMPLPAENFSSADLLAQLDAPHSVLVVNAQQKGYYRVLYEDELWRALTRQLTTNHSVLALYSHSYSYALRSTLLYRPQSLEQCTKKKKLLTCIP